MQKQNFSIDALYYDAWNDKIRWETEAHATTMDDARILAEQVRREPAVKAVEIWHTPTDTLQLIL